MDTHEIKLEWIHVESDQRIPVSTPKAGFLKVESILRKEALLAFRKILPPGVFTVVEVNWTFQTFTILHSSDFLTKDYSLQKQHRNFYNSFKPKRF